MVLSYIKTLQKEQKVRTEPEQTTAMTSYPNPCWRDMNWSWTRSSLWKPNSYGAPHQAWYKKRWVVAETWHVHSGTWHYRSHVLRWDLVSHTLASLCYVHHNAIYRCSINTGFLVTFTFPEIHENPHLCALLVLGFKLWQLSFCLQYFTEGSSPVRETEHPPLAE